MGINFYDYVSKYDFVPFAQLLSSDDFKVGTASKANLISSHVKEAYQAISDVKIEFMPETIKKRKTVLKFKLQKAHQYASDPDGYLRYKLTTIAGQEFVSNHKNEIEHDLGVKKYGDVIEIIFSKNLMEAVQFIDFYFKDNTDEWLDLKGDLPDSWEHCGRVSIGVSSVCYCFEQGIVEKNCGSAGNFIDEKLYEKTSNELGIEKAVMLAIARQESHKSSFRQKGQATILYERHKMWKYLREDLGKNVEELDALSKLYPDLVNKRQGGYGTYEEQYSKLAKAKTIDYDCAIKACSWGKFQVLGANFEGVFQNPKELEAAVNICEIQQFKLFRGYLTKTNGMIKALKNKDWKTIAKLYNGSAWETINPKYAENIKKYYEEYAKK